MMSLGVLVLRRPRCRLRLLLPWLRRLRLALSWLLLLRRWSRLLRASELRQAALNLGIGPHPVQVRIAMDPLLH